MLYKLIILFVAFAGHARAVYPRFDIWYPRLSYEMEYFLQHNCSSAHAEFLEGKCPPLLPGDPPSFAAEVGRCKAKAAIYLTNCLLQHMAEVNKSFMSSAQILLGLLPTVLTMATSSTIETGVLALRRPGLALLLSAGSPAVPPLRTNEYRDYAELLKIGPSNRLDADSMSRSQHNVRVILEYVLAAAAVAGLYVTTWQLCNRTIYAGAVQTWGLPILWILLTVPIHLSGAIAVYLRVELRPIDPEEGAVIPRDPNKPGFLPNCIWKHVREELRLSAAQRRTEITVRKESNKFLSVAWFTLFLTILHLIWGTLALGGTLFISTPDAARVAGQYLASTFVCHAVASYEMRGIRKTVSKREEAMLTLEECKT